VLAPLSLLAALVDKSPVVELAAGSPVVVPALSSVVAEAEESITTVVVNGEGPACGSVQAGVSARVKARGRILGRMGRR